MIAESTATSPKVRLVKAENFVKINVGSVKIEAGMPRMAGMPKLPVQETKEIVVWADFAVMSGDADTLRRVARESLAFRKRTQQTCRFRNDGATGLIPSAAASGDSRGLN